MVADYGSAMFWTCSDCSYLMNSTVCANSGEWMDLDRSNMRDNHTRSDVGSFIEIDVRHSCEKFF